MKYFCVFISHMDAYICMYIQPCAHMKGKRFAYLSSRLLSIMPEVAESLLTDTMC